MNAELIKERPIIGNNAPWSGAAARLRHRALLRRLGIKTARAAAKPLKAATAKYREALKAASTINAPEIQETARELNFWQAARNGGGDLETVIILDNTYIWLPEPEARP